jgi:hypothetical protein
VHENADHMSRLCDFSSVVGNYGKRGNNVIANYYGIIVT